jgi:hypothetical protein
MELPMLFYSLLLFKMGIDDAKTFHVHAIDCWGLLGLSLFQLHRVEMISFLIITFVLCLLVILKYCGNGDRDCLVIMMLSQTFHSWILMVMFATLLSLFYALLKRKNKLPFIFFLSLGHFLNFCLKTL